MFRADVAVPHIAGLKHGIFNDILAPGRKIAGSQHRRHAESDTVSDSVLDLADGKFFVCQNGVSHSAVLL